MVGSGVCKGHFYAKPNCSLRLGGSCVEVGVLTMLPGTAPTIAESATIKAML